MAVRQRAPQGTGERRLVPRRHEQPGLPVHHDLAHAADIGGHDGQPAETGLDEDGGDALGAAREHEHVGGRQRQRGVDHRAEEVDATGRDPPGGGGDRAPLRPIADDGQSHAGQAGHGEHGRADVLLPAQGAHVGHDPRVVVVAQPPLRRVAPLLVDEREQLRRDAGRDHADARGRNAVTFHDGVGRGPVEHDNGLRAP